MATDFNKLAVLIEANTKSYERALTRIEARTNTTFGRINSKAKQVDNTFQSLAGRAAAFGAALASGFAISGAVKFADAYTRINNSLKMAGLSGAELDKVYNELYQSSLRNAAPIESLVDLYSKTALVQKELGASSADLLKFSDNVAVALKASGRSSTEAAGAILQLTQALGNGMVQMGEFNSILEGAPAIAQAAAFGLEEAAGSVGKLRQMVKDGEITSKTFFAAFQAGSEVMRSRVAGSVLTVGQAMTNLDTQLTTTIGSLDQMTGFSRDLAIAIDGIGQALAGLEPYFRDAMQWYEDYARSSRRVGAQIRNMITEMFGGQGDYSFLENSDIPMDPRMRGMTRNSPVPIRPVSVKDFVAPGGSSSGKGSKSERDTPWRDFGVQDETINSIDDMGDALKAVRERNEELKSSFSSLATNIVDGMRRGASATEVMASALDDVASMFIQMGIRSIASSLFGGMGSVGGGIDPWAGLRAVGARAMGGPVGANRPYLVGERGPELFVPSAAGSIQSSSAASSGMIVNIDARGAENGVEQKISMALKDWERQSYQRTVANVQMAKKRRAI
jgi:tape measure domain-containing protein